VSIFTFHDDILKIRDYLNTQILGQENLIHKMLIALLAQGHLLVEGAPGLAKTLAIKSLASVIEGSFKRIQFTPDLLPSDLTGTDIYHPETFSFKFQPGPIFHNLILADEINRAPAKVQSALLEAMAESQVTIGNNTYPLSELFLVMATQNPLEQEGTYTLPEAQLDRFLMYVKVSYPDAIAERNILKLARDKSQKHQKTEIPHIKQTQILKIQQNILNVHTSDSLEEYIVQLVLSTRNNDIDTIKDYLSFGASPRATIALDRAAKIHAWLEKRDYVIPEDIHSVIYEILRHRIILSYDAIANGVNADDCIKEILYQVAIP
jgi:MoxR-like ATPase